ncbi:pseudouridine synthase [Natronospira bacteriovora]|uniref:tRNA pseudouridine synthase C n=1 Tax=Natronospira bacteriovora TaxID=3069753 RepID=A0ABU0W7K2_9GAMM|nr:pseudouridine synthase [Natronospira sp. AB-CW4]MDQ2070008.1 pseudouridine synthase [Natronospira sp. AB-CW4]
MKPLEILHHDQWLVAVNKPPGMLVHRSHLSRERHVILQRLRDQLGQRLYPVHRLDRATSGVLLFALDPKTANSLTTTFGEGRADKAYLAVVRGWPEPETGHIDRPVRDDARESHREARTDYRRLALVEMPFSNRRHDTSRYALMQLEPETGRRHQLRIHMERIAHPIIGDTTHGDGEHNRLFRQHLDCHRLLLHASALTLAHPVEQDKTLALQAPLRGEFSDVIQTLGWRDALTKAFAGLSVHQHHQAGNI